MGTPSATHTIRLATRRIVVGGNFTGAAGLHARKRLRIGDVVCSRLISEAAKSGTLVTHQSNDDILRSEIMQTPVGDDLVALAQHTKRIQVRAYIEPFWFWLSWVGHK